SPGAVVVYSYAQGLAALKQGKAIRYEGPGGPTSFDSYHDSTGIFQIDTYSGSGAVQVAGTISAAQLRPLSYGAADEPVPRLVRLRLGDRGRAGDRGGRLHYAVRRDRRAEPRLRRGDDRLGVRRLLAQPGRGQRMARLARRGRRRSGRVGPA